MSKIDPSEYDLSEDEAKEILKRNQGESGSSDKSDSSGSDSGVGVGLILVLLLIALGIKLSEVGVF